jgi:hypothetical protein
MGGIRTFLIGFAIVFLVPLMLITFAEKFLIQTNPTSPLLEGDYNLTKYANPIRTSLTAYSNIAEDAKNSLVKAKANPIEFVFLFAMEMFTIPINFLIFLGSALVGLQDLIWSVAQQNTLGEAFVLGIGVLFSSLTITAVVYVIKLIRQGESER